MQQSQKIPSDDPLLHLTIEKMVGPTVPARLAVAKPIAMMEERVDFDNSLHGANAGLLYASAMIVYLVRTWDMNLSVLYGNA